MLLIKVSVHFAVLTLVLLAAGTGRAQTCTRHVETQGGFSICVPDGWSVREREGDRYKVLRGPASDSFTPNINFKEEVSTLALREYAAAGIRKILASKESIGADSIEPLGQSGFITDDGRRGIRLVLQVGYKGHLVRTLQYLFDAGNNRKLIVTGTSIEKNKEVFDRVFDRAAKSFRIN